MPVGESGRVAGASVGEVSGIAGTSVGESVRVSGDSTGTSGMIAATSVDESAEVSGASIGESARDSDAAVCASARGADALARDVPSGGMGQVFKLANWLAAYFAPPIPAIQALVAAVELAMGHVWQLLVTQLNQTSALIF